MGGGLNSRDVCHTLFEEIISLENLLLAWQEFRRGKRNKFDVQVFEFSLEDNLFSLHESLREKFYVPAQYTAFYVRDPKLRHIHKACVVDRVLHHAVFRVLDPLFDNGFIFDSYSCRVGKGTHRAVSQLETFCRKLSGNNHRNIFVLKCDVRRFFDSVDHRILLEIIAKKIKDKDTLWLIKRIIESFEKGDGKGLPLGNVTSQLFANIYLNELDQFMKHTLKVKYYLRYCDDFVILGESEVRLSSMISAIDDFLKNQLKLALHPDKILLRKYHQGIDFLGYVVLPSYRVLRTKTKRRMLAKVHRKQEDWKRGLISELSFHQSAQSYLGILIHCKGYRIRKKVVALLSDFRI